MNVRKLREETGLHFVLHHSPILSVNLKNDFPIVLNFIDGKGDIGRWVWGQEYYFGIVKKSTSPFVHICGCKSTHGCFVDLYGLTSDGKVYFYLPKIPATISVAENVVDMVCTRSGKLVYLTRKGKVFMTEPFIQLTFDAPVVSILSHSKFVLANGEIVFYPPNLHRLISPPPPIPNIRAVSKFFYFKEGPTFYYLTKRGEVHGYRFGDVKWRRLFKKVHVSDIQRFVEPMSKNVYLVLSQSSTKGLDTARIDFVDVCRNLPIDSMVALYPVHIEKNFREVLPKLKGLGGFYWIDAEGHLREDTEACSGAFDLMSSTRYIMRQWSLMAWTLCGNRWKNPSKPWPCGLPREIWIQILDYLFYE